MTTEENYKIKERSIKIIEKHGSIKNALTFLKSELESFYSLTSTFSSDCVYHGINFNKLMINYLERKDNERNLELERAEG